MYLKEDKRKEFSTERQIGTFGLKSRVKLGFFPKMEWLPPPSTLPIPIFLPEGGNKEFYLAVELCCPADIERWKRVGSIPKSDSSFTWDENDKIERKYWYRREPLGLGKLISGCPALSRCCRPLRLKSVIKELKMKAFWERVVGENI